ncbi:MATE family efflux transporter [Thalassococcus sp. S3]|uniref:MATE family efflux transporter n=1 Tax=Thalassococcus sp. S3 TaxID=2017482 RepID=UPI0010246CDB|nr:MATE family efflux transporter [Thalassococcus sp. S3]QBF31064.1 MATE family efflux transporter [Thalassococcus sp. S3]
MAEQTDITHKRVLRVAVPIVISTATVPILGAVDTGVVGQMGEAAPIGAVGIGAIILGAIYWMFGFLRMGTVGLTAQAVGQGDRAELHALLTRVLLIGFTAGLVLIAIQVPLFAGAFLVAPASAEVEALATGYMQIRIWSAPAAIAIYGITGWLIAQERTREVLILQLWMNGLNAGLDFWFVLGLGWGVEGVALGTFIAEWSGALLGLWFCRMGFAGTAWRDWARIFDKTRLKVIFAVNRDILIRSLLLETIIVSFMFLGSDFGDVTLAANQVLLQFLMISASALDGFAFAAEALVGKTVGARDRQALRRASVLSSLWGITLNGLIALGLALGGPALIDLMAKAPEVQEAARAYLPWVVAVAILGVPGWMLDGIFAGATRTRDMRNMMVVSFLIYWVLVAIVIGPLANHGLWFALLIAFISRGVTLGLLYPSLERMAERA